LKVCRGNGNWAGAIAGNGVLSGFTLSGFRRNRKSP
jgi:hypothetical protein